MDKFIEHTGIVLPLDIANVDTDAIIPKQFLQKVTRTGFGQHLFHDWRFLDNEGKKINPNFVLNQQRYKGASILLARENFGCGSSREHAPWALIDYGFHVLIAPSFADIFYSNSLNNQLLPITFSENNINDLFNNVIMNKGITFTINLEKQQVIADDKIYYFEIESFRRYCLLNGLDSIDLTLMHNEEIKKYEKNKLTFLN